MGRKKRYGVKESIIDNTILLLAEKSYADITVDDIAKRCGIAKGSVYLHFNDKDEIFTEVINKFFSVLFEEFYNIYSSNYSSSDKLKMILGIISSYMNDSLSYAWVSIFDLLVNNRDKKPEIYDQMVSIRMSVVEILGTLLYDGQKDGFIRDDMPSQTLAINVWSLIDGLFISYIAGYKDIDIESVVMDYVKKG